MYQLLYSFRYLFARHTTWSVFCLVILGVIGTPSPDGLSSLCHFWQMGEADYFRGHQWGVLGLLVGSLSQAFCVPLDARLHHGFAHLRQDELTAAPQPTLGLRLLDMALQFAQRQDCPLLLVLDAFFAVGPVFTRAASLWCLTLKQPYVHILTRAKKHYVAYQEPVPPKVRSRGRPRQYGDPVKLSEVFTTHHSQFHTATLPIYGHVETISYLALNLLWKPLKGRSQNGRNRKRTRTRQITHPQQALHPERHSATHIENL